jgi:hypothetical protein
MFVFIGALSVLYFAPQSNFVMQSSQASNSTAMPGEAETQARQTHGIITIGKAS